MHTLMAVHLGSPDSRPRPNAASRPQGSPRAKSPPTPVVDIGKITHARTA
jgi:hypothetical protein